MSCRWRHRVCFHAVDWSSPRVPVNRCESNIPVINLAWDIHIQYDDGKIVQIFVIWTALHTIKYLIGIATWGLHIWMGNNANDSRHSRIMSLIWKCIAWMICCWIHSAHNSGQFTARELSDPLFECGHWALPLACWLSYRMTRTGVSSPTLCGIRHVHTLWNVFNSSMIFTGTLSGLCHRSVRI